MIVLPEVAKKLQEMLNANPNTDLLFVVNTPGFHLDSIADRKENKNFIPVFISTLGGTNNPVALLEQVEGTIPVTFYFPVRFKDKMFATQKYLNDQLIGKMVDWGTISGTILSNVSLPRYGEIQDLDLTQFKSWVAESFQREIEVTEPFISMELTIYLSSVGKDFIYGNNVKIKEITISYKGVDFFNDAEPICIDRADIASSEPAVQQCFDETYSRGFPANASYTKQIPLIVKNQEQYYDLLNICENTKDIQNLRLTLVEEIPLYKEIDGVETALTVTNEYFVTNYSRKTSLGQLLGISLTLTQAKEEESD